MEIKNNIPILHALGVKYFDLEPCKISSSQERCYCEFRAIIHEILYSYGFTLKQIGIVFSKTDHATIINSKTKCLDWKETDTIFANTYNLIEKEIKERKLFHSCSLAKQIVVNNKLSLNKIKKELRQRVNNTIDDYFFELRNIQKNIIEAENE